MDPISEFTGFGDDIATSVKFTILRDLKGVPQWQRSVAMSQHQMANSDRIVFQSHGARYEPWTVTLLLSDMDAYDSLSALIGRRAALRYASGITNRAGGMLQTILAKQYLVLPQTLLMSVSDARRRMNGMYTCTASFQRHYGGA